MKETLINEAKKIFQNIPKDILELKNIFSKNNFELYIVGGAVRDALMNKTPKDWDLATNAKPEDMELILKDYKILDVGKSFGIIKVVTKNDTYEIATFRADNGKGRRPDSVSFTTIEKDVLRRDLTINALFYDLNKNQIVDLVGGIDDLLNKRINTVGNPNERFDEDNLRKLRAIRFAARTNSKLSNEIDDSLRKNNSLIGVSPERIVDELKSGVKNAKSVVNYFKLLEKYGFLNLIFPNIQVTTKYLKETKCFECNITSLLLEENIKQNEKNLYKNLIRLSYSTNEVYNILFLLKLKDFDDYGAYKLKVEQLTKVKLNNNDILFFMKNILKMKNNIPLRFLNYKITTKGSDLLSQGYKGKELGDAMNKIENEKFNNLNEKIIVKDVIVDTDVFIDESVKFDVQFSKHGMERSVMRDGVYVNIPKEDILHIVNKASDILVQNWNKYPTFIIHSNKNHLNIVGRIIKKFSSWVFHVITLMYKKNFTKYPEDKMIKVAEHKTNDNLYTLYIKLNEMKDFSNFIN